METLAQDLETQLAQAQHSGAWRLKLFSALAHQISQPLTALAGEAELALAANRNTEEYRAVIETLLAELDRLAETVRRFRELAELETPAAPGVTAPLTALARNTLELMAPTAEAIGVELILETADECRVAAPPERLERALHKLLQHALERSPRRSSVRVAVLASSGLAAFRVMDDGPQLSPRETSDLLDRGGNGLAWAFVRRFAESSGGALRIESGANRGCTIVLELVVSERNS